MRKQALAKINLSLDVVGKRADGYHDLAMIMAPIELYDLLDIEIAKEFSFDTNSNYLKIDNNNSIILTIEEMRRRYNFKENFKIYLKKFIPTQAGLAGGSSDAAATIHLINALLKLRLPLSELESIASSIGKDVVFCLHEKTALVEGAGERLTFIPNHLKAYILLVKPKGGVSTKQAYHDLEKYKLEHFSPDNMRLALEKGDFDLAVKSLGNTFEQISFNLVPEISKIKRELLEFGFRGVLMSGSGSCVFALSQDLQMCERAVKHFRNKYPFVWLTKIKEDN